jgi:hypothetical protein
MHDSTSLDSDVVVPPSSMFVFLPGDEPPFAEEIRVRLADFGTVASEQHDPSAEDTLWSFWLDLGDRPVSYLIWCEPVDGPHLRLLDQVAARNEQAAREAAACRFVVGVEGPLSLRHPLVDFHLQLRLADAVSCDWAPLVYDASGMQFRTLAEVKQLIATSTPPRVGSTYSMHRVRQTPQPGRPDRYWIHTHGLQRAGVPDLEIMDVPAPLLTAAQELVETVAGLWIQYQTPEPERPFAVGQGLEISWRPWHAAAEELPADEPGGWAYRKDEFAHTGYRAVLVAARPTTGAARIWRSPTEVLERLTRPETTLFRSAYETRRMAALARERWSSFGMLFAGRRPSDWRFAVKLRFGDDAGHCEHLWFEVSGVRPGKVHGTLISAPAYIQGMRAGDADWHDLTRLSDWRILTDFGTFDPESADALFDSEARMACEPAIAT